MYVVNTGMAMTHPNEINVFFNAASRNGAVQPDVTLKVQGATDTVSIAVDAAGNGYIGDAATDVIYGYDNIATRNGTIAPDRTLKGANTLLATPVRLFVHE